MLRANSSDTYMSAGTLGVGPNAGGQNIFRLTENGAVKPSYVTGHPSAACPGLFTSATGLQHDVEATPKGGAFQQQPNPFIARGDAQLLIDATDATGRCHDNGNFGAGAPNGGLEIIDVTNPAAPKEIALTVHIGNAHTVNVDPKRPHIAFDITQDGVSVDPANDTPQRAQSFLLEQSMKGRMDFLLGSRRRLEPIWTAFGIAPQTKGRDHSSYTIVVDAQGRQRIGFPESELTPSRLAADLARF